MKLTLTGTVRRKTGGFELVLDASNGTKQPPPVVLEGDEETMAQLGQCVNEKITLKGCWNPCAVSDKVTLGSLKTIVFDELPALPKTRR